MAVLNVVPYDTVAAATIEGRGYHRDLSVAGPPLEAAQDVSVGVASAQSNAFPAATRYLRICADVDCRYLVGDNPTALATSTRLPAGSVEHVYCSGAQKIAVIAE